MPETDRWARTEEQIERMQMARHLGDMCGWCGRELAEGETVYIEQFHVGTKRVRLHGAILHRAIAFAPVGRECASPELLQATASYEPEPCVQCGRDVVYRQSRANRRRATCSRRCVIRIGLERRAQKPDG